LNVIDIFGVDSMG